MSGSERIAHLRGAAGGSLGADVMTTDDCRQTYRELRAKGVTFLSEPAQRPYGIETMMRDDSGKHDQLGAALRI